MYGPRDGDGVFLVECDTSSDRITFVFRDPEPSQDAAALDIYTSGQHLLLAAHTQGSQTSATVDGDDARLSTLTGARGTMLISAQPSNHSVALPWDQSISRAVTSCARSEPQAN